jgi:hypothetical protein
MVYPFSLRMPYLIFYACFYSKHLLLLYRCTIYSPRTTHPFFFSVLYPLFLGQD